MCGICGVISMERQINRDMFEKMVDIVTHRGPDDRGIYYGDTIALGHRRLAVIDLSSEGHQPFFYRDRYVMVYNGEIYNYIELRDVLEKKGYHFASKTDTEVLIAMYDCYGKDCVHKLNGMWSFAIYDKKENILFCSRDRFGVKPFYYYYKNDEFLFGSEIKQILTMFPQEKKVYANDQRLLEFLVLGDLDYTEETMFQDIMQLRGGHNLLFDIEKGTFIKECYYDVETIKSRKITYDTACEEFRQIFEQSVNYRLQADVPVGYCLSGGLDSSAIVCVADKILEDKHSDTDQRAFSSCFEDKTYDEQEYIDEVINRTSVSSYKVFPKEEDLFKELDDIIWYMDEPFGSTSFFAGWNVFRTAKENGVTVTLDGQGADEQLAGYSIFYSVAFAHYLRRFRLLRFIHEIYCYCKYRAGTEKYVTVADIMINAAVSAIMPNKLKNRVRRMVGYGYRNLPFSNEIIDRVTKDRDIFHVDNPRKYFADMMRCHLSPLLHHEDRNSMAHSIESRVPFLDYRLVESIYSMPMEYKIRNGMTKAVLRDGLKDVLPEKIRNRMDKLGFVTPEDRWINENFEIFQTELKKSCHRLNGLIDEVQVMDWYNSHRGKIKRGDFLTWRLICAGRWMEVFNVSLKN